LLASVLSAPSAMVGGSGGKCIADGENLIRDRLSLSP
jgi:hypothetical protein